MNDTVFFRLLLAISLFMIFMNVVVIDSAFFAGLWTGIFVCILVIEWDSIRGKNNV